MSNRSSHTPHRIVALVFPEVVAFDLSTIAQVFGYRGENQYSFSVAGLWSGEVATSTEFTIGGVEGPESIDTADTVIVPGFTSTIDSGDPAVSGVFGRLRRAHDQGVRVVSICTGAFALAASGLLDGRRATTHWQHCAELQRDYPQVEVEPGVLYVDHGNLATSAGVAAGIDLCLHLVRQDFGEDVASRIAKRMVVAPHRAGGQAQFIDRPTPRSADWLAPIAEWMVAHLSEQLTVADCAAQAGMSLRHFQRRFTTDIGVPPAQWLNRQRVQEARRLLESSDLTVDTIARRTGLGTATTLRRHMLRELGVTPTSYRNSFGHRSGTYSAAQLARIFHPVVSWPPPKSKKMTLTC